MRTITRRIIVEPGDAGEILVLWPTGRVTRHETPADVQRRIVGQSAAIAERWDALVANVVEWRGVDPPPKNNA